ncbi:hypothetical protein NLI96_g5079 [Meripilus lineatus]|uniref:Uncharacterized protein n=1 Tax=Meripilus lineatus TaxID=2056292 RepID=A0AAD5V5R4_9APHY|nr:hypothetical protein NLI96_g5079 [Physisporinus lineatus]
MLQLGTADPNAYAETSLSTLETLRIGSPFSNTISRPLLGWFPSLKELHLLGYSPNYEDYDDTDLAPIPLPTRSFKFQLQVLSARCDTDVPVQGTVDDLAAGGCLSGLRTLDLGDPDLLDFGGVLRAANGSLRELSLDLRDNPGIVFCNSICSGLCLICRKDGMRIRERHIQCEEMNLQMCTSLETLQFSIEVIFCTGNHHLRPDFEDILSIVRILNRSPIRDVTIRIGGEDPTTLAEHLEAFHWEEMQDLLLSMPTTRSLTFLCHTIAWDPDLLTAEGLNPESAWVPLPEVVEDEFASHLPYLVEKGVFKHAPRGEWRRK